MTLVWMSPISASTSGIDGSSTIWMTSRGAPARAAASASVRVAAMQHSLASGCGLRTIALRVISASRTLKYSVETGFVDGRQAEDHAGRAGDLEDPALGVRPRRDEVVVAVVLGDPARGDLVLRALVRGHAEAGLAHRLLGVLAGVLVRRVRHRGDDPLRRRPVVDGELRGRPLRRLEHHPRPGDGVVLDGDRAHSASRADESTAAASRSRMSSTICGPSSSPGLNCRTVGSSVEKIAHTPFS